MPAEPKVDEVSDSRYGIELKIHIFSSSDKGNVFTVAYCDYPAEFVKATAPAQIFTLLKTGVLAQNPDCTFVEKELAVGAFAGREYVCRHQNGKVSHHRAVLADDRLYFLSGGSLPPLYRQELFDRFFDSFRITD